MIGSILPGNAIWLQTRILEPYMEGSERLNRAWAGKETPSFVELTFSLKERAYLAIKGTLLMIPLINSIIWVAMQIFGEPKLSDGYFLPSDLQKTPSLSLSSLPSPINSANPEAQRAAPIRLPISTQTTQDQTADTTHASAADLIESKQKQPDCAQDQSKQSPSIETENISPVLPAPAADEQIFWYKEKIDADEFEGKWIVEQSKESITINKTSPYNNSTTIYDTNGQMLRFSNEIPRKNQTFKAEMRQEGIVEATALVDGKQTNATLEVAGKGFWIQQPLFGFKTFALSDNQETAFFFVHPEKLELIEMKATKVKEEQIEGLGVLLKIEAKLKGWMGKAHTATTWVDPQTGIGKKTDCPSLRIPFVSAIPRMTEIFLPNHP